jgi:hypothetical protein
MRFARDRSTARLNVRLLAMTPTRTPSAPTDGADHITRFRRATLCCTAKISAKRILDTSRFRRPSRRSPATLHALRDRITASLMPETTRIRCKHLSGRVLRRQLGPSLATAARKHGSPIRGRHTCTEPDLTFPFPVGRLICAFHSSTASQKSKCPKKHETLTSLDSKSRQLARKACASWRAQPCIGRNVSRLQTSIAVCRNRNVQSGLGSAEDRLTD